MIKKPLFALGLLSLLTFACKKEKECAQPAPAIITKTDTLVFHDTIYLDTSASDCRLLVAKNSETSTKILGWDFLAKANQVAAHQNPNDYFWLTKAQYQLSECDSLGYGLIEDSSYTAVFPDVSLSIPDAFTPNGDGTNDSFQVQLLGNLLFFELSVYNRFGQIVFHTNDPEQSWDGKINGQIANQDTYSVSGKVLFFAKSDNIIYQHSIKSKVSLIK